MEFSRQEYWSGLTFPPLGDLPHSGIKPRSLALQADSSLSEPPDYRYFRASVSSVTQSCLTLWPRDSQHAQASLSITNSWSPPKPMYIVSVMPSNHLTLCCPLLLQPSIFPSIRVFQMSQLSTSGGQSIGVSAATSVLPMNTQDWSPLGWTDWISLQSKGLSRVFSSTKVQKHQFFGTQLSL